MTDQTDLNNRIAATEVSDHYGTRTQRRRRVLALYGGFIPLIPIYALAYGSPDRTLKIAGLVALFLFFVAFAYGFYTLMQLTAINAANIADGLLDERQRERRNRALLYGYRALSITVAFAPLWAEVATTAERWTFLRDPNLIQFAAWNAFIVAITLPTAIQAWTEPDPLPHDRP